ncbi:hypothetical protein J4405_01025 [Candidatus Woesearchaeota archaeon]|nr:hypothetical protein [Candidatus Woesearchaeota archaeon]
MTFKHFITELNGNRVEGELIKSIFYSLLVSFLFLGILYFFKFRYIPGFIDKYGFYLFFASLSYAVLLPTVRQVRAYNQFSCMSGMMIGMTIGMIAGFVAGFYIGATNGMLMGSIFGSIIGILLGIWLGSKCGIMGFMEGIMAGFMGGLMGAMTSVMMLNDNLRLATIFIFVISSIIMIGLNYMIYAETKESNREKSEDYLNIIMISFALIALTTWIMLFGYRSLIFA